MPYIDPDNGLPVLTKQPGESIRLNIPIGERMRAGDTISTVDAVTATRVSGTGTVTVSGNAASGTDVQSTYAGGTDGDKHRIEATVTTAGGDVVQADVMLYVID